MTELSPVPVEKLRRVAQFDGLPFNTTAELADAPDEVLGQERALSALRLGAELQAPGFHVFVTRGSVSDLDRLIADLLRKKAQAGPPPSDWVYVHNFDQPHRPRAIALPPGRAPEFRSALDNLIQDLKAALPAEFEKPEYQARRTAIDDAFRSRHEEAFQTLGKEAAEEKVAILRTPMGFAFAPMKDDDVMKPDEFNALPADERLKIEARIKSFQDRLEAIVRTAPRQERERREEIRKLDRQTAELAVSQSIAEARERLEGLPDALAHLARVERDILDTIVSFIAPTQFGGEAGPPIREAAELDPFERYRVNVFVSTGDCGECAPVIVEMHPTLGNLIGRIEHRAMQGALVTNFSLIKPGALHAANGGYLVLDARSVLSEPYSWTALKRTLKTGQVKIENLADLLSLTSTITLEPDPIPVSLKVVLVGDRTLQALLALVDPQLSEHFGVIADFEDIFDRSAAHEALYARRVARIARDAGLQPLDRSAVATVLEHASRDAEDAEKLTLRLDRMRSLLCEADFWAKEAKRETTSAEQVQRAIDERIRRVGRVHERVQESILREIGLIETSGAKVGQVNALSVYQIGDVAFGRPTRVTARVRPGAGKVVDIEREVELGGPLHSKGVLILSGFLAGRYALDGPMSLLASLVFEQSYGGVEGDSASSAELYALLSALSEIPLRQDLAVTGSVNQHGQVQAIGGVNEKVEGFFDLCAARGLSGTQGVLVPISNVQHLMLREDVVAACRQGRFAVYPVATIDDGAALMMGRPAGAREAGAAFPAGSINALVEAKLRAFAQVARAFAHPERDRG
jgi:predicted ATP-dependent protease